MTDAGNWLPLSPLERRSLALECLANMYQGKRDNGKKIDVYDLLIETSDAVWSESTATGDAMFLPGQFRSRFDVARQPEGNIYFAGEHLSYHHTWISGAANSALKVVRDMLDAQDLPPLLVLFDKDQTQDKNVSADSKQTLFSVTESALESSTQARGELKIPKPAQVPFEFEPNRSKYSKASSEIFRYWPPTNAPRGPGDRNDIEPSYKFPTHLGLSGIALGAATASLKAFGAMGG